MRRLFIYFLYLLSFSSATAQGSPTPDTLLVGYTSAPPFLIQTDGELSGIGFWLWDKIATSLEQPYRLVELPFGELLTSLEDGSVDVSINPLTVTSDRSKRMHFTYPFYASRSTVAVRQQTSWQQFRRVLASFFSVNFLRGFLILMCVMAFFGVVAWLFERRNNSDDFRPGWRGLWDGLWWSAVTMTTVGYGDKAPKSAGGKFVALIWMFGGLLFISGFTASIASTLTINQLGYDANNINDFKERTVGTVGGTETEEFLRSHFFRKIEGANGLTDGLEQLRDGKIEAFLYDEPILKYRMSTDEQFAELTTLPIKFDLQFYAFAFSDNHAEINRLVSQKVLEYTESMEWRLVLAEYDLSEL